MPGSETDPCVQSALRLDTQLWLQISRSFVLGHPSQTFPPASFVLIPEISFSFFSSHHGQYSIRPAQGLPIGTWRLWDLLTLSPSTWFSTVKQPVLDTNWVTRKSDPWMDLFTIKVSSNPTLTVAILIPSLGLVLERRRQDFSVDSRPLSPNNDFSFKFVSLPSPFHHPVFVVQLSRKQLTPCSFNQYYPAGGDAIPYLPNPSPTFNCLLELGLAPLYSQ